MESEELIAATVSAMNAEYAALRDEIRLAAEHQRTMVQIGVGEVAAICTVVGIVAQTKGGDRPGVAVLLLLLPLISAPVILTTADASRRIVELASYLNADLRPRLAALIREDVWLWDAQTRRQAHLDPHPFETGLLDRLRWAIFLMPLAVALPAYFTLVARPGTLAAVLAVVDAVVTGACLAVLIHVEISRSVEEPAPLPLAAD